MNVVNLVSTTCNGSLARSLNGKCYKNLKVGLGSLF